MNTPCRNCEQRELGCHIKCEKYLALMAKNAKIYEQRKIDVLCKGAGVKRYTKAGKPAYFYVLY